MANTDTDTECTPRTCGCKGRTDEEAVIGALITTGRARDRATAELDAKALLWTLREYGWSVTRDDA